MDSGTAIAESWRTAADDLGIVVDVRAGFKCQAGEEHECIHVPDFGSRKGTIACPLKCSRTGRSHDLAEGRTFKDRGHYFSLLSDSYEGYDRDLFVATLDDWGWHGEGSPPSWYSGAPWTDS
jgi:hypothetical protein